MTEGLVGMEAVYELASHERVHCDGRCKDCSIQLIHSVATKPLDLRCEGNAPVCKAIPPNMTSVPILACVISSEEAMAPPALWTNRQTTSNETKIFVTGRTQF